MGASQAVNDPLLQNVYLRLQILSFGPAGSK